MTRSRRFAALTMIAASVFAPIGAPADAAPADVEASVSLRNLTLAAGGDTVEEFLGPILFAGRPGWAETLTMTIDTSQADVVTVRSSDPQDRKNCTAGRVMRCVLPGPHRVYERPKGTGTIGLSTYAVVSLSLTPKPGASIGDSGTLKVTTTVDGGKPTIETSTVRIGEGVNLTAIDVRPRKVAPGGAVALHPEVRNSGSTAVDGLTAVFSADDSAFAGTDFGNCTYGWFVSCTFDQTLDPGATYRVSDPFTLRAPPDAAAGSEMSLGVQWLTAAEWQDFRSDYPEFPGDRPGTGPDLDLEPLGVSAAEAPQADIDQDDNGSSIDVTVAGSRRTDVAAVGATIKGEAGKSTFRVGLVNRGPGTLRHPPFLNNLTTVRVVMPPSVAVVAADSRCRSESGHEDVPPSTAPDDSYAPPQFDCTPRAITLRPGQSLTFTFTVRMGRAAHDDEGSVWVDVIGAGVDRNFRNDQAVIRLASAGGDGGLPITGTTAATIAGAGVLLLLLGVAVVVSVKRRAVSRSS